MGGKALSTGSVRLVKSDYERVAVEVVDRLKVAFPGNRVYAIESYRSKGDFGDLDVLIESSGYDPHVAAKALEAVEVVRNGPVTSVGVKTVDGMAGDGVFQVDLIRMEPEGFDFASRYFRFSDMGNLLGRVAHATFTALRHDGLFFYFRDGDYKFREIELTRDWGRALKFLGYEPSRYEEGYDDLEEVFQYVSGTTLFNRDIFLLENRNAQARVRDRKRPTYTAFLKWLEERPGLVAFKFPDDKKAWLPRLEGFFPGFKAEYERTESDLAALRAVGEKFNGELVARITGLQGKALGMVMKRFKEGFESPADMRDFVLSSSTMGLEDRIRQAAEREAEA